MELSNSNSEKKIQQLEVFRKFATVLNPEQKRLNQPYLTAPSNESHSSDVGEQVLRYNDFVNLISNSRTLYSKFTDHSFNLNQIPNDVFGCIFFAMDERNKGFLTISDWFHFNNLLEYENYHLIILYEFFRKFDIAHLKAESAMTKNSNQSPVHSADDNRIKSINYGAKSLSFDELYLNLSNFKSTIKLLQETVNDEFLASNNLFLNWNDFKWLKFYQSYPYNVEQGSYLSLNTLVTIMQSDLKSEKLFMGFDRLCHMNHIKNSLAVSKNQLVYLLKLFYSHRIPADVFNSMNLSNSELIKCDNNYINYNVFKDIFYLIQNFDLLNQVFIRYAQTHEFDDDDLRESFITKEDLIDFLNVEYSKVNNITEFSPSQINLLFSIVANSKVNNLINKNRSLHHQDTRIDNFIHNEYGQGGNIQRQNLKDFNSNYQECVDDFNAGTISERKKQTKQSFSLLDIFSFKKKQMEDHAIMQTKLTMEDFMRILNPNYLNDLVHTMELRHIHGESWYSNFYFYPIFDSIYNFTLGSIAGCIGATVVYPIDLVKTRMQAQRSFSQYKNSIDCFVKIFSREGIRGIYSGLGPQLIGVAPEKAIKLTVNDYMRGRLMDKHANLKWYFEILSGACAGACQVVFTNPLEVVKIRLQVRSEYAGDVLKSQVTALGVIKQLGIKGLYKGIAACLMRDVPFSAIYFPTYAHLKKDIFKYDPKDKKQRNKLKTWELLVAGGLAGMPAAYLTTPFDVIKTRLQIDPRKGETRYEGIFHAARTILKEESFKSFFKGGSARVLRSSPQFGFTLAAYEIFQNMFPLKREESTFTKDDTPAVTSSFTAFFKSLKDSSRTASENTYMEFFSPSVDPYSDNYLNYYYKSCQVAKVFIDLDYNFSKFDFRVYSKFHETLKAIESNSASK